MCKKNLCETFHLFSSATTTARVQFPLELTELTETKTIIADFLVLEAFESTSNNWK